MLTVHHNAFPGGTLREGTIRPKFPNAHVLIWFREARGRYTVDFRDYVIRPGTIILISKDQQASFQFAGDRTRYTVITFADDLVSRSGPEIRQLISFCIREHFEGKQILAVTPGEEAYLETLVGHLAALAGDEDDAFRSASRFHFLQLLLIYCRKLRTEQGAHDAESYTTVVGNFTSLLEKSFRSTHKVTYYTDNLNITYNSLARYTTSYCSKTPKEIIVERVVLEIKRLLSGTAMPVKEIAFQLGFDEPTNLIKYFKKYTGTTPAAFRAQA